MYQMYMRNYIKFLKYMKVDMHKYKITPLFLGRTTPYYQTPIPKLIIWIEFGPDRDTISYSLEPGMLLQKNPTDKNTNKDRQENCEKEKKMRMKF